MLTARPSKYAFQGVGCVFSCTSAGVFASGVMLALLSKRGTRETAKALFP